MRILENNYLRVEIADFGAELSGIFDKTRNHNVIWKGDPEYWARHAPVLFPFVGKVNGGFYTHMGACYNMGQHGFARDRMFEFVKGSDTSVTHILKSCEETKKVYPFDFELKVIHTIQGNRLKVNWEVSNSGDSCMYFSIGGHPAFNCPVDDGFAKEDYYVRLGEGKLKYVLIDAETGSVDFENPKEIQGEFRLSEELFDNDALIFDDHQIERASILYPDKTPYVTVECKGFPSFGLWSKPKSGAPFVCLEPWIGRCDNMGFDGELKDKYGVQKLAAGDVFKAEFSIVIG